MDFLNNLLTAAAGYYGADQKNDAQLRLAGLGLQATNSPVASAPATGATKTIIPGVENSTLLIGGGALFALGVVVLLARRR